MAENDKNSKENLEETKAQEINKIHSYLYKEYLSLLKSDFFVLERNKDNKGYKPFCFKVTRLVEPSEKRQELFGDKLKNVFSAFNNTGVSIALLVNKKEKNLEFYFFVKSKNPLFSEDDKNLLKRLILSNFNGSEIADYEPKLQDENSSLDDEFCWVKTQNQENFTDSDSEQDDEICFGKIFKKDKGSLASVSAVATEKSEKFISQGLEKLFDVPSEIDGRDNYAILILAESLTSNDVKTAKEGFESLATELSPFSVRQESNGKSFSDSVGKMQNSAHTSGTNKSISNSIGGSVSGGVQIKIVNIGTAVNYNHARANGTSESDTQSTGTTQATINTITNNSTLTYTDFQIKNSLEKIEQQVKRLDVGKALGLWKTAAYICAESSWVTKNIANMYKGLIQGEESFIEPCVVNEWSTNNEDNKIQYNNIIEFLRNLEHPIFCNGNDITGTDDNLKLNDGSVLVTPAVFVNSSELAWQMCFPKKSVPGLPVLQCAQFGRQVSSFDPAKSGESIRLGDIFNMYHKENNPVELNINSLASHTFITGSTGSGKSFTVYRMLSRLAKETAYTEKYTETKTDENGNVVKDENGKPIEIEKEREVPYHFLVIEPAKGEYKNEFGKYAEAVYGTNPKFAQLLRINPFSFYDKTHILEHLDRLIEIFNVCWPMYAAMPAVLKEAVEKSYEDCGWDLALSENKYDDKLFPTFSDVTRNIRSIIDSSDYDSDNKGAYKGSLITRLKSLSNGINGQIFSDDEIPMEDLFEKNVIVDLSRVGSAETKSLIMGLLVLKLQEYRMNQGASKLKHVTVLEEAHNLLKRTSTEQSSESANLLGKSVEMLTNSIAEMRAFGEGFIIADQAPGLLDMAVIRNTNTKIILRLPDQSDRELVGKAAGLNDDQIKELAKLPCGVAAVYQNEWIEPVLCKVDEFTDKGKFEGKNDEQNIAKSDLKNRLEIAKLLCSTPNEPVLLEDLKKLHLGGSVIAQYLDYKNSAADKPDFNRLSQLVSSVLFEFNETVRKATLENSNAELWRDRLSEKIDETFAENQINDENEELKRNILQCILQNLILNELKKPELLKELNPRGGAR